MKKRRKVFSSRCCSPGSCSSLIFVLFYFHSIHFRLCHLFFFFFTIFWIFVSISFQIVWFALNLRLQFETSDYVRHFSWNNLISFRECHNTPVNGIALNFYWNNGKNYSVFLPVFTERESTSITQHFDRTMQPQIAIALQLQLDVIDRKQNR